MGYDKDTYSDGMVLIHEIDYQLNKDKVGIIIKSMEDYEKLSDFYTGNPALDKDGRLFIGGICHAYEYLTSGQSIYYDKEYDIYYDPKIHNTNNWRN